MKKTGILSIITVFLLFPVSITAQEITEEDYKKAERFLPGNVGDLVYRIQVNPNWQDESSLFWYRVDTRKGREFIYVDPEKNEQQPLFNQEKLARNLSEQTGEDVSPYDLPFNTLDWYPDENTIHFRAFDKRWIADLETLELREEEREENGDETTEEVSVSPDGQWAAFTRDYNLFIRNTETGEEHQLTESGEKKYRYGAGLQWAHLREIGPDKDEDIPFFLNVSWSDDSKKLFAHRIDIRKSGFLYLLRNVPEEGYRSRAYAYQRSLPRDEHVTTLEPYVFNIESKTKTRLNIEAYDLITNRGWNWLWHGEESDKLYYIHRERGFVSATLLEADAATGEVREIFREESETYVDPMKADFEFLADTGEFLWLSERDGWNHIYLYDLASGELKQQLTKGEFVVNNIEYVDEEFRKVYFTAGGREVDRDPYLGHLYVVGMDGAGLTLLTPENASHQVHFSPNREYFVNNFSRADQKPQSVLRRTADGSVVMHLEEADIEDLKATGWQYPEPYSVKARDGETDIYGVIFRPSNFDENRTYPVIDATYSGPHTYRTPKSFYRAYRNHDQSMAELGFIVVTVDGLGTAGRSKEFQDFSYKNLGDIGADDHEKAIRELCEIYTYMDCSRVGIYGHSAGGYDAARALMLKPDFYKVGVSTAGNHDHRVDKTWWQEVYLGYPHGKEYDEQSNLLLAENLKGHLLLIHGDMDNNVHPAETYMMADALIQADKDFDFLIIPNANHNLSNNHYVTKLRWNYFVRYLLGTEPPRHYSIQTE